jgi:hypothetical protein
MHLTVNISIESIKFEPEILPVMPIVLGSLRSNP